MTAQASSLLLVIAIAAMTSSLTTGFHEGVHALSCALLGGQLVEFSALHVDCQALTGVPSKIVAGCASMANLVLGFVCLMLLRRTGTDRPRWRFFLWLFMLLNWLSGTGYWMFSGIANVGDWAAVIEGWQPHALWRIIMTLLGSASYMAAVWYALVIFGRIMGGQDECEQLVRANRLTVVSYAGALAAILIAGLLNPYGILGLPALAGLFAAAGGYAALLWMMQWFQAKSFVKRSGEALIVSYSLPWLITAVVVVLLYAVVLGLGLNFT